MLKSLMKFLIIKENFSLLQHNIKRYIHIKSYIPKLTGGRPGNH